MNVVDAQKKVCNHPGSSSEVGNSQKITTPETESFKIPDAYNPRFLWGKDINQLVE